MKKKNLFFIAEFRGRLNLFSASIGLRTCPMCNASVKFQIKIRTNKPPSLKRSPKYQELGLVREQGPKK